MPPDNTGYASQRGLHVQGATSETCWMSIVEVALIKVGHCFGLYRGIIITNIVSIAININEKRREITIMSHKPTPGSQSPVKGSSHMVS